MKEKKDTVSVEMHPAEAHLLWNLLKDVLSQDQEGKDTGQGGLFYPKDVTILLKIMGNIAKELDTYAITNKPAKPTLKLI